MADIVEVCAEVMGADGAALIATAAGQPDARRVVHATDVVAARVADLFYLLGVGPERECLSDGAVHDVVVDDPVDRLRWPVLVGELSMLGVGWVRVFATGVAGRPVGTMQSYRRTERGRGWSSEVDAPVTRLARAVGDHLMALDAAGWGVRGGCAGVNDSDVVDDSDVVNMAIVVLAARYRVPSASASAMLRAAAYTAGRSSAVHAQHVLDILRRPEHP